MNIFPRVYKKVTPEKSFISHQQISAEISVADTAISITEIQQLAMTADLHKIVMSKNKEKTNKSRIRKA